MSSVKAKHAPTPETVGTALVRIKQMRESSYLPVATSSRRVLSNTNYNNSNQIVDDGEEENRNLFSAPSSIEVRQKSALFDDGVTEVSEITTDIRTKSLRGASYAERRMAGKLQKRREENAVVIKPAGKCLDSQKQPQSQHELHLEMSSSYVESGDLQLKPLIRRLAKLERAKSDLRKSELPGISIVRRHGLPYEATDFSTERDENYSVDSWDGVIRRIPPRVLPPESQAMNPTDVEVISSNVPPSWSYETFQQYAKRMVLCCLPTSIPIKNTGFP